MIKDILEFSKENKLGHIPSALSMLPYLEVLIKYRIVTPDMNIIIDKVFGASAYYIVWNKYWNFKLDSSLDLLINHNKIPFVDFAIDSLGNSLGVASGIYLANNKKTWVNVSDSIFEIGGTLEAIQFIGNRQLDIFLTVDVNEIQLTGQTREILNINIDKIKTILETFSWRTLVIDINNIEDQIDKIIEFYKKSGPRCILFKTIKGYGVKEMMEDPVSWHYKRIENIEDLTICERK